MAETILLYELPRDTLPGATTIAVGPFPTFIGFSILALVISSITETVLLLVLET